MRAKSAVRNLAIGLLFLLAPVAASAGKAIHEDRD